VCERGLLYWFLVLGGGGVGEGGGVICVFQG